MHALKVLSLSVAVVSSALAAEPVKLFPGWKQEVPLAGVEKVESTSPAVVDAQVSKAGLVVTAKAPGSATVRAWKKGAATPELVTVQVEAAGWSLVTVLVAARDLEEGHVLTAADVAIASLPSAVVTSSCIRDDQQHYVLAHRNLVPIQAGDVLWWAAFESKQKAP